MLRRPAAVRREDPGPAPRRETPKPFFQQKGLEEGPLKFHVLHNLLYFYFGLTGNVSPAFFFQGTQSGGVRTAQ